MELIFDEERIKLIFKKTNSVIDNNYKCFDFSKLKLEFYNATKNEISFIKRFVFDKYKICFVYTISLINYHNFEKIERFLKNIDNIKFVKSKIEFIFKKFICNKKELYIYSYKNLCNFVKIHNRLKIIKASDLKIEDMSKIKKIKDLINIIILINKNNLCEFEINNFSFVCGNSKLFINPNIYSTLELNENIDFEEVIKFILFNNKSNSLINKLEKIILKSNISV